MKLKQDFEINETHISLITVILTPVDNAFLNSPPWTSY